MLKGLNPSVIQNLYHFSSSQELCGIEKPYTIRKQFSKTTDLNFNYFGIKI